MKIELKQYTAAQARFQIRLCIATIELRIAEECRKDNINLEFAKILVEDVNFLSLLAEHTEESSLV